jgi:hypothetical protein
VRFKLDGKNLGSEDPSAPYSLAWNTTSVSNGSHLLSVLARDAAGNTKTSAAVTVTVKNGSSSVPPNLAPAISRLKLSAATFRKSTTISFKLSEAAKVRLSVERKLRGHKKRGKCVASAKKGARCSLYRRLATKVSVDGTAGLNSLRLGRRGMPGGSYRLALVATDSSGKRSATARIGFRLVGSGAYKSRASVVQTAIRSLRLTF